MSELINILKAKSDNEDSEVDQDINILLKDHIIETLKRLQDFYGFIEKNSEYFDYANYRNKEARENLFKSLAKALTIHDLGKVEFGFQKDMYNNYDKFKEQFSSLEWEETTKGLRHEIYSVLWSLILLKRDDKEDGKIRTTILLHHYNDFYVNKQKELWEIVDYNYDKVLSYLNFLEKNKEKLTDFLNKLLDEIKNNFEGFIKEAAEELTINFDNIRETLSKIKENDDDLYVNFHEPDDEENKLKENLDFLVMSGILKRCDHTGSGGVDIENEIDLKNFYANISERIKGIIYENIKPQYELFWQNDTLPDNDNNSFLVAPTGSGKTEYSILWATKNPRKLIYTLPLRVALNDLYKKRFIENYSLQDNDNKQEISLLHSSSFLEFSGETGESVERKITSSKQFSAPMILTTPDQVFLSSLNYFGSDKLYSIYPLSTIVIDEIQAYNPEMSAIIFQTLDNIQALGGRILVMTATHPPYFETFLENFQKINIEDKKENVKNYQRKRHKIKFLKSSLVTENNSISEDLTENIKKLKEKGKNILLITNTVKKAVELYKEFSDDISFKTELLHSRLIEMEKERRIENLKNHIRNKEENSSPVLLISTQMVEASVDVDFDVLLTEISPIDSQVQRWGRVHRNREENYNEEEPNIIIFGETEGDQNKATKMIYDKDVVNKTAEALKEYDNLLLGFEEEKELFNEVFQKEIDGVTLKDKYVDKITELKKKLQFFSVEKRSESQRLFRNIAGSSFVFPDLMKNYASWGEINSSDCEWYKNVAPIFAEIIKRYDSKDKSWKDIINEIKERYPRTQDDKKMFVFKLRKLLHQFSINIPLFFIEDKKGEGRFLYNHEFKGFFVFPLSENYIEGVTEKGIDSKERIDDVMERNANFLQ